MSESTLDTLHRAHQVATDLWRAAATAADLGNVTSRQVRVLAAIDASEDRPSQTDLVDLTGIDRSTMADLVRRLIDHGLVHRRRSKDDGRAYDVKLTDQGKAVLSRAKTVLASVEKDLARRVGGISGLTVMAGPKFATKTTAKKRSADTTRAAA